MVGIEGINFAVISTSNSLTLCLYLTPDADADAIELPMQVTRAAHIAGIALGNSIFGLKAPQ